MDDREAVARLQAGDLSGLETLVRRYQVRALRAAFLISGERELAEEAVQEAFLRFYRGVRRFDPSRPVAPYLYRIVVNTTLNMVRRERRDLSLEQMSLQQAEALLAQAETVEGEVERALLAAQIEKALAVLSPRQRAVIVRRYYLEMSEQEMADAMGVSRGTIKRLLHNARGRLRRILGEEQRP